MITLNTREEERCERERGRRGVCDSAGKLKGREATESKCVVSCNHSLTAQWQILLDFSPVLEEHYSWGHHSGRWRTTTQSCFTSLYSINSLSFFFLFCFPSYGEHETAFFISNFWLNFWKLLFLIEKFVSFAHTRKYAKQHRSIFTTALIMFLKYWVMHKAFISLHQWMVRKHSLFFCPLSVLLQ